MGCSRGLLLVCDFQTFRWHNLGTGEADEFPGVRILGASSDHLWVAATGGFPIGAEVRFTPNYSALLPAMTSPFVDKTFGPRRRRC